MQLHFNEQVPLHSQILILIISTENSYEKWSKYFD